MFHQHILTREDSEIIKKVYTKQKESNIKGDWFRMLVEDFEFIQVEMKEDTSISTPKEQYRKLVKN